MKALTWQGPEKVAVEEVPDPRIEQPTDAIVRVTSTAICGSDLHLYSVLAPFLEKGDILGHEAMGIVEEVGPEAAGNVKVGDRVVIPFNISCGHCWMCTHGLQSQCETTQVAKEAKGASLFGYTKLYGQVPGGQAEYMRVPQAQYGPIVLPQEGPDERWLYLSDILPTAWQAVQYGENIEGATVLVTGLGPVGQLTTRIAKYLGAERVIGVDLVPERLDAAQRHGIDVIDLNTVDDPTQAVMDVTSGRGADAAIEAVGMEAHGHPGKKAAAMLTAKMPKPIARAATENIGVDSLAAFELCTGAVRRGGTVSLSGVYGGAADPIDMMTLFDKQLTLRMGQANVKRWTPELFDIISAEDVFDVENLATHRLPLEEAPAAYEMFQKKQDGCMKVVLKPGA